MLHRLIASWIAATLAMALAGSALAAPQKAAFFGIVLIDSSLGQSQDDENRRVVMIEELLVTSLIDSGRYEFVDTGPVAKKANLYSNLSDCNGCDASLADELGADVAITGVVQKTSNLILSFSLFIRDAKTGELINGGSADIRGNTDESWLRGVRYIIKNRILRK